MAMDTLLSCMYCRSYFCHMSCTADITVIQIASKLPACTTYLSTSELEGLAAASDFQPNVATRKQHCSSRTFASRN
jgi:hypothetical protein